MLETSPGSSEIRHLVVNGLHSAANPLVRIEFLNCLGRHTDRSSESHLKVVLTAIRDELKLPAAMQSGELQALLLSELVHQKNDRVVPVLSAFAEKSFKEQARTRAKQILAERMNSGPKEN